MLYILNQSSVALCVCACGLLTRSRIGHLLTIIDLLISRHTSQIFCLEFVHDANDSCSKAVLPIEMALMKDQTTEDDDSNGEEVNMQQYMKRMDAMRDELFEDAKGKITKAQFRQKRDYDKKHGRKKVNKCIACK